MIAGSDDVFLTEIYDDLTEGRYPAKEDEILLSHRAKERLSLNICCRFVVELSDFLGYTGHTERKLHSTTDPDGSGRRDGENRWAWALLSLPLRAGAPCFAGDTQNTETEIRFRTSETSRQRIRGKIREKHRESHIQTANQTLHRGFYHRYRSCASLSDGVIPQSYLLDLWRAFLPQSCVAGRMDQCLPGTAEKRCANCGSDLHHHRIDHAVWRIN